MKLEFPNTNMGPYFGLALTRWKISLWSRQVKWDTVDITNEQSIVPVRYFNEFANQPLSFIFDNAFLTVGAHILFLLSNVLHTSPQSYQTMTNMNRTTDGVLCICPACSKLFSYCLLSSYILIALLQPWILHTEHCRRFSMIRYSIDPSNWISVCAKTSNLYPDRNWVPKFAKLIRLSGELNITRVGRSSPGKIIWRRFAMFWKHRWLRLKRCGMVLCTSTCW